jgi:hypothetical protein
MEKEEEFLLESLGWKGKGLINSSINAQVNIDSPNGIDCSKNIVTLIFFCILFQIFDLTFVN